MFHVDRLMQDFDLLFSDVGEYANTYFFHPMKECEVNYPVFDQKFNDVEQQIIIAATGASKADFKISLVDDILSVKRTNNATVDTEHPFIMSEDNDEAVENKNYIKYNYSQHKISKKKFDIAFKIPSKWDATNLTVKLEKGELIITIPIKEEEKSQAKDFSIQ